MNVFISWSGALSKEIASEINDWIPTLIQAVKTFFSPEDIQKGDYWTSKIKEELKINSTGIICLTKENQKAPWILFEAGALSNGIGKKKVFPLLFDFSISELEVPLSLFNATEFSKTEFLKLVQSINNDLDNRLDTERLIKLFETLWPELENKVKEIINKFQKTPHDVSKPLRKERDILEEILSFQRESLRIISANTNHKESNIENIENSILKIENVLLNLQSEIVFNKPDQSANKNSRPKKIDADIYNFELSTGVWFIMIGLINSIPMEIYTGSRDSFYIPGYVNKGLIIKNSIEPNEEIRFDFQFQDKAGYSIVIPTLNRKQNDFQNYTEIISKLLTDKYPFWLIKDFINNIITNNDDDTIKFKSEVIKALEKYFSPAPPSVP